MSRHHVDQKWSTFTRKRRAELEPQLPLPCIARRCLRGGIVHRDPPQLPGMRKPPTTWHVGHLQDAGKGGRPTRENTGPIHAACNLRDGGRAGAAVVHSRRPAKPRPIGPSETDANGIRPW